MDKSFKNNRKGGKPIYLALILLIATIVFLFLPRAVKGTNLWVDVAFYTITDIGFLVALILGIKTKNKPIVLFSVLLNGALFIGVTIFIYLLLVVIGIAGPN
ncbi:MAG TPA: hypothetical protein GX497_01815 [Bacillus bacterium]|nr:hypothetical protein [Bacillus sp. (in: firmicutes)]